MKRSRLIPVEVLRVEDKIFASLSFLQIGLLACPIFITIFLLFMPPAGELPIYKLGIVILVFAINGLLAYRLHGRLICHWLLLIGRYNQRPKTYIRQAVNKESKPPEKNELLKITEFTPINVEQFVPAHTCQLADKKVAFKQRQNKNQRRDML